MASLLNGNKIEYETELDALRRLAFLSLDRLTWFEASESGSQSPSTISDEAWRQIRTRVVDQNQYPDVLAELYVWGCLSKERNVELVQEIGRADLSIHAAQPVAAEVKRISLGTSATRVKKVITKANKQIKNSLGSGLGPLFILLERSGDRAALDDALPSDVEPFADAIKSTLKSARFSGVDHIILAWDEIHLSGSFDEVQTIYTYARKSRTYTNGSSAAPGGLGDTALLLANSTTRAVIYDATCINDSVVGIEGQDLAFSAELLKHNERSDGVRRGHVLEALRSPSAHEEFVENGLHLTDHHKKCHDGRAARANRLMHEAGEKRKRSTTGPWSLPSL